MTEVLGSPSGTPFNPFNLVSMEESETSLPLVTKPEITDIGELREHEGGQVSIEIEGRFLLTSEDRLRKWATQLNATAMTRSDVDKFGDQDTKIRVIQVQELYRILLHSCLEETKVEMTSTVAPCQDPIPLTKDPTYYLESAVFEVEDRRFLVPKHHFLGSTIFEGFDTTNNNDPIKLTGVLKGDFYALLKLTYPLRPPDLNLTQDEWMSVLKLATKWKMLDLRSLSLESISIDSIPPLERVVLGREYRIPDWLRSGYVDLALRTEALSVNDFKILGIEAGLKLSQMVRRNFPKELASGSKNKRLDQDVKKLFHADIYEQAATTDTVDRILLAQQYGISEWVFAGYTELACRQKHISLDESRKLGLERTVKICQVREGLKTSNKSESGMNLQVENKISEVFAKEINGNQIVSPFRDHSSAVPADFAGCYCLPLEMPVSPESSSEKSRKKNKKHRKRQ